MPILVTGCAGFIGSAVTDRLLADGREVIGIDNLNSYYSVALKRARLARLEGRSGFHFTQLDIADREAVNALFAHHRPQQVVHLAAQPGVRYAVENPHVYLSSNVQGFLHVLEAVRAFPVRHLIYASTSSVYGANLALPFDEAQAVAHPLSLYAATKAANELMAHSYAHLFGIAATGLRFFTVYGPWTRPDMALLKFGRAILAGRPIQLYNHGRHTRSFTYIDDIVEGIVRLLDHLPTPAAPADPGTSAVASHRIYNIGSENSEPLLRYVDILERCLGRQAQRELLPLQAGDVPDTAASVARLFAAVGYKPRIDVETGVARFAEWLLAHRELCEQL